MHQPFVQNFTERWLSVQEVAAHLGVSRETIYAWIKGKRMPAHRVGRHWKFKRGEVDDWVRRNGAADSELLSA